MRKVYKLVEDWRKYNQDYYSVGSDPFYGPPPLINDVVDCWAIEGVPFYTQAHHANGMVYHVMLPTEELEFHVIGSMSKHNYSFMGQQLIDDGYPPRAVRIIVGRNGKAIIDRDAEIVWAAKHVGVEEFPVLFSFQEEA